MREAANPKSAAFITGSFVSIFSGALILINAEDSAAGAILFSGLLLIGLVLLITGLMLSWRTREKVFEFKEPSGWLTRTLLRTFRIVAGFVLFGAGCFMLYLSFTMYARGGDFPWMGLLWGVLLIPFGIRGIKNGLIADNSEQTDFVDRDSDH